MRQFYLRRGHAWICAPDGQNQASHFAGGLTVDTNPNAVWLTPSLDIAHERQALLRHVHGWATEIRAIHVSETADGWSVGLACGWRR
jgi:hypothetical protein